MEESLEGLSHEHLTLFYAIQLKAAEVAQTLKIQGNRLSENDIKTMTSETMCILCMTQTMFREANLGHLFPLIKGLGNNFSSLVVLLTEKIQKLTQKVLLLQRKQNEDAATDYLKDKGEANDHSSELLKEVKHPKMGGVHMYNQDYSRNLEDHRILQQLQFQKQNRILKKRSHMLNTMIYQELEQKVDVEDETNTNDELTNYIIESKKKQSIFNYTSYEEEMKEVLAFFENAQNDANQFLLHRARLDQKPSGENVFSFADFQREIQISKIRLKKSVSSKFRIFIDSFSQRQRQQEQSRQQKQAYYEQFARKQKEGVEQSVQTDLNIHDILKKSKSEKKQLQIQSMSIQGLKKSEAECVARETNLKTEIKFKISDIEKLDSQKKELQASLSGLKKLIREERTKKQITVTEESSDKASQPQLAQQKSLKTIELGKQQKIEENKGIPDDRNSEVSLMNSTRRLMYTSHDWKMRTYQAASLDSSKEQATNTQEGGRISRKLHNEPKQYAKHQAQNIKQSEKNIGSVLQLDLQEKRASIQEESYEVEGVDFGIQTQFIDAKSDRQSEAQSTALTKGNKNHRLSTDNDGHQTQLKKTEQSNLKQMEKLKKNGLTSEVKSQIGHFKKGQQYASSKPQNDVAESQMKASKQTKEQKSQSFKKKRASQPIIEAVLVEQPRSGSANKMKESEQLQTINKMLQVVEEEGEEEREQPVKISLGHGNESPVLAAAERQKRDKLLVNASSVRLVQRQPSYGLQHLYTLTIQPFKKHQLPFKQHQLAFRQSQSSSRQPEDSSRQRQSIQKRRDGHNVVKTGRLAKHSSNSTDVTLMKEESQKQQREVKLMVDCIPRVQFGGRNSSKQLVKNLKKQLISSHSANTLTAQEIQNIVTVLALSSGQENMRSNEKTTHTPIITSNRFSLPELDINQQSSKPSPFKPSHQRCNSLQSQQIEDLNLQRQDQAKMEHLFQQYSFQSSFHHKFKKAHKSCKEGPACKHVLRYIQTVMRLIESVRLRQKQSLTMHVETIGKKIEKGQFSLKQPKPPKNEDNGVFSSKQNLLGLKGRPSQNGYQRQSIQKLSSCSKMVKLPVIQDGRGRG